MNRTRFFFIASPHTLSHLFDRTIHLGNRFLVIMREKLHKEENWSLYSQSGARLYEKRCCSTTRHDLKNTLKTLILKFLQSYSILYISTPFSTSMQRFLGSPTDHIPLEKLTDIPQVLIQVPGSRSTRRGDCGSCTCTFQTPS